MSKNTVSIDDMGKDQLRAACKAAGITGYGKLSNLQMREALKAAQPAEELAPVVTTPAEAPAAAAPADEPKEEKPAPAVKDSRNNITRPKAGSICAQVWDACDAILASGQKVTFAGIKERLPTVNDSTARTQIDGDAHQVVETVGGCPRSSVHPAQASASSHRHRVLRTVRV